MWGVCWAIGCVFMSDFNLSITAMLMPNSLDVDIGAMKKALEAAVPSNMMLHKIEEIHIEFGLVSLKVMLLGKDQAGGIDELENNFSSIDNITQVEVTDVRRLVG